MASGCGKCFKVTGSSNISGHGGSSTVVLKGTNYCPPSNPSCAGQAHFDIAAPGFDYPYATQHSVCDAHEGEQALHSPQTCAFWMIHSGNPDENCDCNRFQDSTLRNGCYNFKSLYWNNPQVYYEETQCPPELEASPPCWNQNGGRWPATSPAACSAP